METDRLFDAAGELRETYSAVDWSQTPVGPSEGWSPTLRAAFAVMARTEFACTLLWGPEHVLLYNAAYVSVLDEKHPDSLGRSAAEVFPEVWDELSPLADAVTAFAQAVYLHDALVPLRRGGSVRHAYFTYCYSPVCGPTGEVEGVLDIVSETTGTVLATRRLALIDYLREALADATTPDEVRSITMGVLHTASDDVVAATIRPLGPAAPTHADAVVVGDLPRGVREVHVDLRMLGGLVGQELALTISDTIDADESLLSALRTIGVLVAHSLNQTALLSAERATARAERTFSEALQLSLLGEPEVTEGVAIEVCYVAAARAARVGGD